MKNLRVLILGGLLTGSLVIAGTPAMADGHKEEREHRGLHKGWEKNHHGWVKEQDNDDRYENHHRHDAYYGRPYQYRHPFMSTDIIMGTDIVITGMTFTTASAMFVQRAKASHRIDSN